MMALTGGDVISLRLPLFTCPNSTSTLIVEGRSKDVFDSYSQWDEGAKSLRLAVGGTGVVVAEQLSISVRVSCTCAARNALLTATGVRHARTARGFRPAMGGCWSSQRARAAGKE
jgi:hypothetical protein